MENVKGGSAVLIEFLDELGPKLECWVKHFDKERIYSNLKSFTHKYWERFDEQDRMVVEEIMKRYEP